MSSPPNVMNQINEKGDKSNLKKIESINFNLNNQNFIFDLSSNDEFICFHIENSNSFPKKEFELISSFESLKKINTYFLNFENTKELNKVIIESIKEKNIFFKIQENICEMNIINPINKRTFSINIPIIEKDMKNNFNDMIIIIQELQGKILLLEEKVLNLENNNKKLNDEMEILKKFKEEIESKKKMLFNNSSIIQKEDLDIILNFFDKKPTKFNLLFDTKIDGDANETFHNKVNNKCPTFIIIKTTNGFRFGGYTSKIWANNDSWATDNLSFIFSLDKKKNII